MILTHAQFEAMFAGLDWRRVHAIKTRTPDIDADATDHPISALTNCGGFPDVFANSELSHVWLIADFDRVAEIQDMLRRIHLEERHADCDIWTISRWQGDDRLRHPTIASG